MKINVGSLNPIKIAAVAEAAREYPLLNGAEVAGQDPGVDLFGHPKSLEEVVNGAINRAQEVFKDCDLSFGLEGGLMAVPHSKTGYMEISVCAIYDGKNFHMGLSPAYEWPKQVTELILNGMDGSQALKAVGMTDHEKIGTVHGGIWYMTHGRMDRKEYTKLSIQMAMVHLENPEHFK